MPVVLCKVHYDWNEHWEGLIFIGFKYVQEVVVFEEAHSSVSNLQVDTSNALDNALKQTWDQVLDSVNLANLKHFLQLGQEKRLFYAVGKWPVLKEAIKQVNCKCAVLGEEQHGATEKLLVELRASLHLMKRDDHVFEENDVLVSQRHGET